MYKTILVPLDGSPFAEQALPVAVATARASAARMHLVHVRAPDPVGWQDAEQAINYMTAIADRVSVELDESVTFSLIGSGHDYYLTRTETAARIATYASEQHIDLIVMATRGAGGIKRAFTGSVADALLRASPAPLLLVRPDRNEVPRTIRSIMVAVDHTAGSESILNDVAELAEVFGAEVILLHVLAPSYAYTPEGAPLLALAAHEDAALANEAAQQHLEGLADRLRARGLVVCYHTLMATNVSTIITEASRRLKPDIIAMATRAPRPLLRAVVGSVTDNVVRHTPVPVLVTRQD